jgi:hypothetical protein
MEGFEHESKSKIQYPGGRSRWKQSILKDVIQKDQGTWNEIEEGLWGV